MKTVLVDKFICRADDGIDLGTFHRYSLLCSVARNGFGDDTHLVNSLSPDHKADDLVRGCLAGDPLGHLLAAPHDHDAVCHGEDVLHVVADDDHRDALTRQGAHQGQHLALLRDAQGGSRSSMIISRAFQ